MRKPRFTFPGAFHHVMSRGIRGEAIFTDNKMKEFFLTNLIDEQWKQKIRVFAHCILDNHYHLILQNSSGRMSEFMRAINGKFGSYYRFKVGGKGYVFQGRYKSTLIQEGRYLRVVIIYVILNSVRAGIIEDPYKYKWSSIHEYYNRDFSKLVDNRFVEELFESKEGMRRLLGEWVGKEIPLKSTRLGAFFGDENFIEKAVMRFDRRNKTSESIRMRHDDYIFEPPEEVIKSFEEEKGTRIEEIRTECIDGKELRSELLILLRDRAGLRYKEIIKFPIFKSFKYSSLSKLYKRAKEKMNYVK